MLRPKFTPLSKSLVLLTFALIACISTAEIASRRWLRAHPEILGAIAHGRANVETRETANVGAGSLWAPHPLFGFVSNSLAANNFGFLDQRNFPYPNTAEEIVVG